MLAWEPGVRLQANIKVIIKMPASLAIARVVLDPMQPDTEEIGRLVKHYVSQPFVHQVLAPRSQIELHAD